MTDPTREQRAAFRLFDRHGVRAERAWLTKPGTGGSLPGGRWYPIKDYELASDLVTLGTGEGEHEVAASLLHLVKDAPKTITVFPESRFGPPPPESLRYRGVCPKHHDVGTVQLSQGLPITCPTCGYEYEWKFAPN